MALFVLEMDAVAAAVPATIVPVGRVRVAAVELDGCLRSRKMVWPTWALAKVGAKASPVVSWYWKMPAAFQLMTVPVVVTVTEGATAQTPLGVVTQPPGAGGADGTESLRRGEDGSDGLAPYDSELHERPPLSS